MIFYTERVVDLICLFIYKVEYSSPSTITVVVIHTTISNNEIENIDCVSCFVMNEPDKWHMTTFFNIVIYIHIWPPLGFRAFATLLIAPFKIKQIFTDFRNPTLSWFVDIAINGSIVSTTQGALEAEKACGIDWWLIRFNFIEWVVLLRGKLLVYE